MTIAGDRILRSARQALAYAAGEVVEDIVVNEPAGTETPREDSSPVSGQKRTDRILKVVVTGACGGCDDAGRQRAPVKLLGLVLSFVLLAGCTPSPPQAQAAQPAPVSPACQAGSSARGLAAGFFAIVQDRPECF